MKYPRISTSMKLTWNSKDLDNKLSLWIGLMAMQIHRSWESTKNYWKDSIIQEITGKENKFLKAKLKTICWKH